MGKGSSKSTSTSSTTAPSWLLDNYQSVIDRGENVSNTPYAPYTGQRVAGFNADQTNAFGTVAGMQGMGQPYVDQASQYAQQGAAPITTQNILDQYNPYIDAQVGALQNDFNVQNQREFQNVNSNAAKMGALTGDRSQVANVLTQESQRRQQDPIIAGIRSQGFNEAANLAQANKQNAFTGANAYSNLGQTAQNLSLQGAQAQMQTGALQQAYDQANLDVPYQDWLTQQAYPFQTTQWLASLYGGIGPLAGSETTGTQTSPQPSIFSQILGGIGQGVGAYLSDERVKENIVPTGEFTPEGLPIYSYNFIGSPQRETGVIAQEVAQVKPEAVVQFPDGVLGVDYSQIGTPQIMAGDANAERTTMRSDPGYRAFDDAMLDARLRDGAISSQQYDAQMGMNSQVDRADRRSLGQVHRMDFMPSAQDNPLLGRASGGPVNVNVNQQPPVDPDFARLTANLGHAVQAIKSQQPPQQPAVQGFSSGGGIGGVVGDILGSGLLGIMPQMAAESPTAGLIGAAPALGGAAQETGANLPDVIPGMPSFAPGGPVISEFSEYANDPSVVYPENWEERVLRPMVRQEASPLTPIEPPLDMPARVFEPHGGQIGEFPTDRTYDEGGIVQPRDFKAPPFQVPQVQPASYVPESQLSRGSLQPSQSQFAQQQGAQDMGLGKLGGAIGGYFKQTPDMGLHDWGAGTTVSSNSSISRAEGGEVRSPLPDMGDVLGEKLLYGGGADTIHHPDPVYGFMPMLQDGPAREAAATFDGGRRMPRLFDFGGNYAAGGLVEEEPGITLPFQINPTDVPGLGTANADFQSPVPQVDLSGTAPSELNPTGGVGVAPSPSPAANAEDLGLPPMPTYEAQSYGADPEGWVEGKEWYQPGSNPDLGAAIAYGGAEMMAGDSPYAGINIGKGIAAGLLYRHKQLAAEREARRLDRNAEYEAARLARQAALDEINIRLKEKELNQGKMTELQRNLIAAGMTPGTPEYNKAVQDYLRKPNAVAAAEKSQDQVIGKSFGEESVALEQAANNAHAQRNKFVTLQTLLSDPNLYTGTASETVVQPLKKAAKTLFGLDLQGVGTAEAVNSVSGELAGEIAKNFKPVTNFELSFAKELLPGLSNSAEGNALLVEIGLRNAERAPQLAALKRQYEMENDGLNYGWWKVRDEFERNNPLVTEEIVQKFMGNAAAAQQPSPVAGMAAENTERVINGVRYKKQRGADGKLNWYTVEQPAAAPAPTPDLGD